MARMNSSGQSRRRKPRGGASAWIVLDMDRISVANVGRDFPHYRDAGKPGTRLQASPGSEDSTRGYLPFVLGDDRPGLSPRNPGASDGPRLTSASICPPPPPPCRSLPCGRTPCPL